MYKYNIVVQYNTYEYVKLYSVHTSFSIPGFLGFVVCGKKLSFLSQNVSFFWVYIMTSYLAWVLGMALVGDADISRTAALAFLPLLSDFREVSAFFGGPRGHYFTATASNRQFDKG